MDLSDYSEMKKSLFIDLRTLFRRVTYIAGLSYN